MTNSQNIIPPNDEVPCYCCHRKHRKLFFVDGYWMGRNCVESYKTFLRFPEANDIAWIGWAKKYEQVKAMVNSN